MVGDISDYTFQMRYMACKKYAVVIPKLSEIFVENVELYFAHIRRGIVVARYTVFHVWREYYKTASGEMVLVVTRAEYHLAFADKEKMKESVRMGTC